MMERKRRARINSSLEELKNLIIDVHQKDPKHSKFEKADILSMTVTYLKELRRQQLNRVPSMSPAEPSSLAKFTAGFNECAHEVSRYMTRCSDLGSVQPPVRQRLLSHLSNCLTSMQSVPTRPQSSSFDFHLLPTRLPGVKLDYYSPSNGPTPSSSSDRLTPRSPLNVLGSSGILSPAASERSCSSSSEDTAFPFSAPCYESTYEPSYEPISPVSMKQEPLDLNIRSSKISQKNVWRPF